MRRFRAPRHALVAAVAVIPIVAVACGGSDGASSASASPQRVHYCPPAAGLGKKVNDEGVAKASGSALETVAQDSFFLPTCITGVTSGPATVTVKNSGSSLHNISIPAQGIDKDIEPGQSVTVPVTVGSETVQYFCKYHKSSGMLGAIVPAR